MSGRYGHEDPTVSPEYSCKGLINQSFQGISCGTPHDNYLKSKNGKLRFLLTTDHILLVKLAYL